MCAAKHNQHSKPRLARITTSGEVQHGCGRHVEVSLQIQALDLCNGFTYGVDILQTNGHSYDSQMLKCATFKIPDVDGGHIGKNDKPIFQQLLSSS